VADFFFMNKTGRQLKTTAFQALEIYKTKKKIKATKIFMA
jgi:hypothetical protein